MITTTITFDDLQQMDSAALHAVMQQGSPLDREAMADTCYQGIDLSMPSWAHKILWKTFRKTFMRDGERLRGWNVRVEQRGVESVTIPMRERDGRIKTFGHYVVSSATGKSFPNWSGADYLDYGIAGNTWNDAARTTYSPLVTVNAGDHRLLLGWEIFRFGPRLTSLPLYWALRYEGALPADHIAPVPRP